MTEDEAKTKWCPFVRHTQQSRTSGESEASCNRYGIESPHMVAEFNSCMGSSCMAWRWSYDQRDSDPNILIRTPPAKKSTTDGHCGLAGKP